MADIALAREALHNLLALPTASKEAKYFAKLALSHLPQPIDPNIQHPATAGALGGPFPEEDP